MPFASLPAGFDAPRIQAAVLQRYSDVATSPDAKYPFRVGRPFAEALGYPKGLLDQVPASAWEAFTGVACPSLRADIFAGDVVVDLGCGGGLDLVLLARAVGASGRAIGIDFAPGMAERARRSVRLAGITNAAVIEAPADATGLPDAHADCVIANGILNLSVEKAAIVREIVRILKPGGRFYLAEITLSAPLPTEALGTLDDWFR